MSPHPGDRLTQHLNPPPPHGVSQGHSPASQRPVSTQNQLEKPTNKQQNKTPRELNENQRSWTVEKQVRYRKCRRCGSDRCDLESQAEATVAEAGKQRQAGKRHGGHSCPVPTCTQGESRIALPHQYLQVLNLFY